MKFVALALIVAAPLCAAKAVADQTHAMPLAAVAQKLGFVYAYLGPSDVVSLAGHGISIVVRPGVPYFTVNERVEPVRGDAPRYQSGDLYISPQFVQQLTKIERSAAHAYSSQHVASANSNPAHINVAPEGSLPQNVTAVTVAAAPGSDDVVVNGEATPDSRVSIVLKAIASPQLPTIFINRSFAVADKSGHFSKDISTAPEYFSGSVFIAEASATDDAKPMTARFTPPAK